jgi:hypothetical protein
LTIPPDWTELLLDEAQRDAGVDNLLASAPRKARKGPVFEHIRGQMHARAREAAQKDSVMLLAFFDATPGDDPPFLAATLSVFVTDQTGVFDVTPDQVVQGTKNGSVASKDGQSCPSRSQRGPMVSNGAVELTESLTVRYLIPVVDGQAILSFWTPEVAMAEEFTGLFDQMAETFTVE